MIRIGHDRELRDGERIVSIARTRDLRSWTFDTDRQMLRIGAAVPWSELTNGVIQSAAPALTEAARTVGSPQIRNTGTLGGNVATASPAGDGLCVLVALDAVAEIRSAHGTRMCPVHELVIGAKSTTLKSNELITALEIPVFRGFQGYAKVGTRNAMVISIAGVCLVTDPTSRLVRLTLGSVGPTILRAEEAEVEIGKVLFARADTESALPAIGAATRRACRPIDDHRSSADYRRHAVGVLAQRLTERALRWQRKAQG